MATEGELQWQPIRVRELTTVEQLRYPDMVYATQGTHELTWKGKKLFIKEGFLSDGSTKTPDGFCGVHFPWWLYHDKLYADHKWTVGGECTRKEADNLMFQMMWESNMKMSASFFWLTTCCCYRSFAKAWKQSGDRGSTHIGDTSLSTTNYGSTSTTNN